MNQLLKIRNIMHRHLTKNMCSSALENDVLFEIDNNVGIITLNRPKALNSLNESMVKKIYSQLKEWENNISFVIVRGNSEKAFCAGGDVVSIARGTPKNSHIGKSFFRNEYKLNYLIAMYKPVYIALIDGVTMGGGVGISVHGSHRIATERTLFAMPETAIGLFPDVGGTCILPRLHGKLGLYLGLTGVRLRGIDVVKAGIATHYINSENLPGMYTKLKNVKPDYVIDFLKDNTINVADKEFSLNAHMDQINSSFSGNTIEDIFELLKNDNTPWSSSTLDLLSKMSPISLKLTKRAIDMGAKQNIRQCLITEYRLACAAVDAKVSPDFYEGVRALLIDKDKNPKWNPSSIEAVTDEMIQKCFTLPGSEDLDI